MKTNKIVNLYASLRVGFIFLPYNITHILINIFLTPIPIYFLPLRTFLLGGSFLFLRGPSKQGGGYKDVRINNISIIKLIICFIVSLLLKKEGAGRKIKK
jgi:hypothetical protein|nr:MAG TPA: hypothetical protein [Caudoviricetes sp.]